MMDNVAARIRKIGHYAPVTLAQLLQLTHLSEQSERKNDSMGFLKDLPDDHENNIEFIRGNINSFAAKYNDAGTSDFVTGLMDTHEEMAWMIRAHFR